MSPAHLPAVDTPKTDWITVLATGIAASAPDMIGQPYVDAAGRTYGRLLVQPMLVFESGRKGLQAAHKAGLERELTLIPYVFAMFSTGHDEANRAAFAAEDRRTWTWWGWRCVGRRRRWTRR